MLEEEKQFDKEDEDLKNTLVQDEADLKLIEKFPDDFDVKSEAQIDNEVYKYTGKDFDITNELQNDQA